MKDPAAGVKLDLQQGIDPETGSARQASGLGWEPEVEAQLRADAGAIIARYPEPRSALGPLLHLIQSVDTFVSPRGVALCAELLDLTRAEVSAVATFYSQYKRKPNGRYTLGVCTNTLCAVMGGDAIFDAVADHLGLENEETSADGAITLERLECNAACDYAPVVMVNWEFFDNQTPASAIALADDLVAGVEVTASRGPVVQDFRHVSRVLAGFEDGLVDGGAEPGEATLVGLRLAREHDWSAPAFPDGTRYAGPDQGKPDVGAAGSSAQHAEPIGQAEQTGSDLAERSQTVAGRSDATAGEGPAGQTAASDDQEKGTDA